jgi:hypothetical protein
MKFACLGYADGANHPCLRAGHVMEIRPAEEFNAHVAAREALVART